MTRSRRAIVVAGPASGVGKTTIALGLMAAFGRRGLTVQPFKCGPDFIDAGHHTRVCGRPSRNLDGWMLSPETNLRVFTAHARPADIAIVEGVMGLFDGARSSGEGSTAAMAKQLRLPVLLVVDASKMAASAAALVRGFETFDPAVRIAGVVFNQVARPGHYGLLREALELARCAPAVGYLPPDALFRIPERHLGLYTADEEVLSGASLEHLASLMEQFVDLDRVLEIAEGSGEGEKAEGKRVEGEKEEGESEEAGEKGAKQESREAEVRIAVARDRAFCFYYEDNLDALRAAGAEIVEFSPLVDRTLPEGTDALYIGGGYPELHAPALSANESMRGAIGQFAASGAPVYAECGGLMYLGRRLRLRDGHTVPMVGVLPLDTVLTEGLVRFGYTEVCITRDCLVGRSGATARGHSFHYSAIEAGAADVDCVYRARSTLSGTESLEGYVVGNVLASYIHLHFLSNPDFGASVVRAARMARSRVHTT